MQKKYIALKPFNNKIFFKNAVFDNKFRLASPYLIAARKLLEKNNYIINTIDIASVEPTQKDIYLDVPYPWQLKLWLRILMNKHKSILFILEPPVVNPFNYAKLVRFFFSKIYTWKDNLVDNKKYFKFNYPKSSKGLKTKIIPFKKKKFLVLMNSNWVPFLPFKLLSLSTKELYSQRIRAIEFFDKHHSSEFDLFGKGWNKPEKYSLKQKLFGYKTYKTYRGEFKGKDKYSILSKFKYALCFENSEVTGYISEKIVDCFKAKCVPIYYGATNIKKFIPANCYIEARRFDNYDSLYNHLKKITEKEYDEYINNIQKLIKNKIFLKNWFESGFAKLFLRIVEKES